VSLFDLGTPARPTVGFNGSVQPPEQLREADLQDVGDLPRRVHGDVDPAAFEQADASSAKVEAAEANLTLGSLATIRGR
jgi:hypothetical protein